MCWAKTPALRIAEIIAIFRSSMVWGVGWNTLLMPQINSASSPAMLALWYVYSNCCSNRSTYSFVPMIKKASQTLSSANIEAEIIIPPHLRSPMQIGTGLPLAVVFFALPKA